MGKKVVVIIAAAVLTFLGTGDCLAQRTAQGESILTGSALTSMTSFGGEVFYGRYLLRSEWGAGVGAVTRTLPVNTGETLQYLRLEGMGRFMYRVYGTRSRAINAYVGGDLFVGCEFMDPFRRLSATTKLPGYSDAKFIFGLSPRLEGEFFLTPSLGLVVPVRVPVTFLSQFGRAVGVEVGLGVRYVF